MPAPPARCNGAFTPLFFEGLEPRVCLSQPTGLEFLINTTTASTQDTSGPVAVATQSDGDFVAVWESLSEDALGSWGIYGRRYASDGTPLGPEFLVNSGFVLDDQQRPSVAVDAAGDFVVAWEGVGVAGLLPSIYAQRYNAAGVAQGGEITVALGTILQPKAHASLAMNSAGGFIVTWESSNEDTLTTSGVYARIYASDGTALASEFVVNQTTAGDQVDPVAVAESAGSFVIAWSGQGSGDTSGVFVRRFTSAGVATMNELLVNTTVAGTQEAPILAVSPTGNILIAWDGAGAGDAAGIFAQRYDSAFTPLGGEAAINDQVAGVQSGASAKYDLDGDYVIAWSGQGTGDVDGVYAREFAANGTARGVSLLVNTTTAGAQANASIAWRRDNSYIVTWSGAGAGDADGVFGRLLADEPPVVATTVSTLAYTENAGAVVLDSGVTISDADNANLSGVTVSVSGNYDPGEDVLAFVNQSGITGLWNAASGVLTLSGAASVAAYQAALRTVTYTNTSDDPSTLARSVSFVASDGTSPSAAATRTISVLAVNDPPVVVATGGTLTYTENAGGVAVDPGLTVSDLDNNTLAGATVSITSNYALGEDLLTFVNQSGIVGLWDAAAGVLTLSGVASLAAYQAALRTVTYANTSDDPSTLTRTVTLIVSDGTDDSAPAARSVGVVAVNDPPLVVTTSGALSYVENSGAVEIDQGLMVSDVDSTLLTGATVAIGGNYSIGEDLLAFVNQSGITGSWNATAGVLTLSGVASLAAYQAALRSVTYTNTSDDPSTLARAVSFIVNDGIDASAPAIRTIGVVAVNDPPVVATTGGALTYTENAAALAIDPGLTITDLDSVTLAGATITISGNFAPGQDVLAFVNQSGISGSWNAASGVLTLSGVASLAAYQAALRSVTYTNTGDNPSTAARAVSFVVSDGTDSSVPATRTIGIVAVNDPPVVVGTGSTLFYVENSGAVPVDPGLAISDLDDATLSGATVAISGNYSSGQDVLAFVNQSGIVGSWNAAAGVLTLSGVASLAAYQAALRTVSYTNNSDNPSTLARMIAFIVNDGTDSSAPATRTVSVLAVNDPPVVVTSSGALAYTENSGGQAIDAGLAVTDTDSATLSGATVAISANYVPGQDALGFTAQSGITGSWNAASGVLTLSGVASVSAYQAALRSITYTNISHNPSVLVRVISFTVNDGVDASAPATRALAVLAVNDPPVVVMSGGALSYVENSGTLAIDAGLTVTDMDNATLSGATVAITGNYAPGQDRLTFVNQSGLVGSWDSASGTMTLTGIATLAAYQSALRSVSYVNTSDNPSTLARTVMVVVDDGASASIPATRGVGVVAVNDAPIVVTSGGVLGYTERAGAVAVDSGLTVADLDSVALTGATITLGGYAIGQDLLGFTSQSGIVGNWDASAGVLTLSGTAAVGAYQNVLRSVTYTNTSKRPSIQARVVSFVVSDGTDAGGPATRGIAVTPVNDPPTVTSSGPLAYIEKSGPVVVDPGISILDVDSSTLSGATVTISTNYVRGEDILSFNDQRGITGSWDPAMGVLTLSGTASLSDYATALRSVTYTNTSDDPSSAARAMAFQVTDGTDPSVPALVQLGIIPVDDPPLLTVTGETLPYTTGDEPIAIDPGVAVSDPDNQTLVGARVAIVDSYMPGTDVILFTDQSGIRGSWDPSAGVLTLSGVAPLAAYQAALRSVLYQASAGGQSAGVRTIAFTVDDGGATATGARGLAISTPAPSVVPDPVVTPPAGTPPPAPPSLPPAPVLAPPDVTHPPIPSPVDTTPTPVVARVVVPTPVVPIPAVATQVDPTPVVPATTDSTPDIPAPIVIPVSPNAASAAPAVAPVDTPPRAASPGGTIQLIEAAAQPGIAAASLKELSGLQTRLTTVVIEAGGTLGAGYIVWLLVTYSLARHSLFLLPRFDPIDVHCLLSLAGRSRRLAG